ncbi:unnamed protein product [Durusdinium trenchii]|uniref:Serine/threonine-protein phosphatase n=1 Tax=Durusdinium trenchii TaxID=1381693 RepID=A0ABP0LV48_9DINO
MKCGRGHELHLTHLPCARKHRCTVCHEVIPRSARRFMCRRCSYDVCFDCGMHDNCLIDRSKDSQKTLRSVFKEYAMGHQRSVAISTTYDIISPSDGHMRRHQHKRGLGVGEDCRYAVFSDATMNVDTFHLPTPSERPSSRETPSSSDPTIAACLFVVKRCMQLVDVVAAEVAAGFDCLDHEWLPKRHAKRAWRGLQELRIQTGDSHLILTSPEGDVLKEWAEALRKEIDTLIRAATELQKLQPIVSEVTAPVKVFGILAASVFLVVHWMVSVVTGFNNSGLFLFGWIVHPKQVWLNRGNHEDRQQNLRTTKIGSLGFDRACFEALGAEEGRRIFESFQSFFEWLPLAARIEQKVLVLHGGLGPGDWTLEDLSQVERPLVSKELHFTLEGARKSPGSFEELWRSQLSRWAQHFRFLNKTTGDVTQRFCKAEGLELVIRSHQFTNTCKGYELMHDGYLLRVFSARNYMGTVPNDGGMLLIGYGEDSRGSVSLVVRPRSVERLTGANRGRQNTELPGSILSYEPYCPRKHLMQLIKPEQVRCFGWTHRDSDDFRSCSECGQDDIQVECYFACRGCGDYDICIDCAGRLSRGLQALPAFSPPSRSVDSPSGRSTAPLGSIRRTLLHERFGGWWCQGGGLRLLG